MRFLRKFWNDSNAAEVTELALVLALIVTGCIVLVVVLGGKVQQCFTDTANVLP